MRQIEPLAGANRVTRPLTSLQIEGNVAGLQHTVEPLGPSEDRRFQPFDDPHSRQLG